MKTDMCRKIIGLLFIAALPAVGSAQLLNVATVERIDVPEATPTVAAISAKGDYLLLTSPERNGLVKFSLNSSTTGGGDTLRLTNAMGAGINPKISKSGNTVVYRETTIGKDRLRRVALRSIDLAKGKAKLMTKATHDLQGYAVDGEQLNIMAGGKRSAKALARGVGKNSAVPTLSILNGRLMLTRGGETTDFSPNGTEKSYIWPELSPDATKVVYYVAGEGAYVCNIDGSAAPVALGIVRAPKWYDNSTIVGMEDHDDGESVYTSTIVAVSTTGERQQLIPDSIVAMYPLPAEGKISFSTPRGEAYMITVSKSASNE